MSRHTLALSFPFGPVVMLLAMLAIAYALHHSPNNVTTAAAIGAIVVFVVAFRVALKLAEEDWRNQEHDRIHRHARRYAPGKH